MKGERLKGKSKQQWTNGRVYFCSYSLRHKINVKARLGKGEAVADFFHLINNPEETKEKDEQILSCIQINLF